MKLTKAQKRCLASVASGTVHRHFDVYGGYKWTYGDYETAWRKSEHSGPSPILRLLEKRLIELGPIERPYSGRHIAPYALTDAGRAALSEGE